MHGTTVVEFVTTIGVQIVLCAHLAESRDPNPSGEISYREVTSDLTAELRPA
jgi:hypothetical protein